MKYDPGLLDFGVTAHIIVRLVSRDWRLGGGETGLLFQSCWNLLFRCFRASDAFVDLRFKCQLFVDLDLLC